MFVQMFDVALSVNVRLNNDRGVQPCGRWLSFLRLPTCSQLGLSRRCYQWCKVPSLRRPYILPLDRLHLTVVVSTRSDAFLLTSSPNGRTTFRVSEDKMNGCASPLIKEMLESLG